jgi:hypothetical protein
MVKINKLRLLELICLALILTYPTILYLSHQAAILGAMTQSDALLIARVLKGLILDHEHLKDWILPGAPGFFPDWLFFLLPFGLFKNLYHQILLGVLIQFSALYFIVRLTYGQFFPKKEAIYFSLTTYLIFILLGLALHPYVYSLTLLAHIGAFIIGLLCVYLNLKQLANLDQNKTFVLTTLSFLTALSDGSFIINFSIPIFLSYCYLFLKRSIQLKTLLYSSIPLLGSYLGVAILPYIIAKPTLHTSLIPSLHLPSLQASYQFFNYITPVLKSFYQVYPLFFIMFLAFILIVASNSVLSLKKALMFKSSKNSERQSIFFEIFILLGSLIWIGIGALSHNVNIEPRYMTVLFFMPILFFFYLLKLFPKNNLIKIGLTSALLGYCLYLAGKNLLSSDLHIKWDFYPDYMRCVDQALHQSKYRVGIGQYWTAHPMTQVSKQHVKVLPVTGDLTPFRWNTNNQWFKDNYTFAIVDASMIDAMLLRKLNGEPKQIVDCGLWKLWIYPDHQLKINV